MPEKTGQRNFIWLTLALVGMLLAGAFTREFPNNISLQTLEYSSTILMLVSLRSLSKNRSWMTRLISLIGITLLVVVAKGASDNNYFDFAYLSLLFIFFASAALTLTDFKE